MFDVVGTSAFWFLVGGVLMMGWRSAGVNRSGGGCVVLIVVRDVYERRA